MTPTHSGRSRPTPAGDGRLGHAPGTAFFRHPASLAPVFDLSPAGVALLEAPDHRFVYVNAAFRRLATPTEPFLGRSLVEVWPEAGGELAPALDEVRASGEPFRVSEQPFRIDRGEGAVDVWLTLTALPARADESEAGAVLLMVNDVTAQARTTAWLESSLALTAALSGAHTEADVARVIFEKGLAVFGADAGLVATLDAPTNEVELSHHFGYSGPALDAWRRFPLSSGVPLAEAIRTAAPVWVESCAAATARFPEWTPAASSPRGLAWAALPLAVGGPPFGALGLTFRTDQPFTPEYQRMLEYVASRCAQALVRARALDEARRSEAALRVALEDLRLAKEAAAIGIHDFDVSTGAIRWDERVRELWGVASDEPVTYDTFLAGLHPQDRAPTEAAVARALDPAGPGRFYAEYRVRSRRDGAERWIAATGHVSFAEGRAVRLVGTVLDVTDRHRDEEALRNQASLLGLVGDAVVSTDEALRVRTWNRAAERTYGFTQGEALGRPVDELLRTVFIEAPPADSLEVLRRGGSVRCVTIHHAKDGAPRQVQANVVGLRDELGTFSGTLGVLRDVTEQRRLEEDRRSALEAARENEARLRESQDRLALALSAGRVGIWEYDLGSGAVHWTPETRAIMGRSTDEFAGTGQAFFDLVHPEDLPGLQARLRDALEGDAPYEHQFRVRLPAGSVRWVQNTGRVIRGADGAPIRMVGTIRDVSQERAAEAALRELDERRVQFMTLLAHELRNPLAPMRNSLVLLERAPAGSDVDRRAREILQRQTTQLSRLVDDLLDVTRISAGKLELRLDRLDARDAIRRACDDLRSMYEQRGVALHYTEAAEPAWVDADAARLSQMIGNLLHNALKFTPPGGRVDVVVERRDDACAAVVRDTGVGIAPEDLPHIFDRFMQAERTRGRSQGGLGLGLALVSDLAARLGGTVRATSAGVGRGAEFEVLLPLQDPPASDGPGSRVAVAATALDVLVVEDDADAAATLAELLRMMGHSARLTWRGRDAVSEAKRAPPDVLLCDVGLPDLSGHDVIREVRALPAGSRMFGIALTGFAQPRDRDAALAAGFDAHLAKPPDLDELAALLRDAASRLASAQGARRAR
jgi:PAS domain S-box-containing protein